jgi:hypothetical protein
MAVTQKTDRLTLTVTIDGEQADIDIDPAKSIGDVIKHALVAFGIEADPRQCHLAGPDRLYMPYQKARTLEADRDLVLSLRLPL